MHFCTIETEMLLFRHACLGKSFFELSSTLSQLVRKKSRQHYCAYFMTDKYIKYKISTLKHGIKEVFFEFSTKLKCWRVLVCSPPKLKF